MTQLNWMAWREILNQVFDGFVAQSDASPEWLVNPATGRRLKLDCLYPEIGLAVRFIGGQPAARRRRASDWEVMEEEQRDETRAVLCQEAGVTLLLIDPNDPEPRRVLGRVCTALGGASRRLAQSQRPPGDKARLMPELAAARKRCYDIRGRLKGAEDLALFAELLRDREVRDVEAARADARRRQPRVRVRRYHEGQKVRHTAYGSGTVVSVLPSDGDVQVTVQFILDRERTFLASLVGDKLLPRR